MTYTKGSIGCWIDGAFGQQHRRDKLIEMVDGLPKSPRVQINLARASSDDLWEEQDAVDLLQEHTEDGLIWLQEAGDLTLCEESEGL